MNRNAKYDNLKLFLIFCVVLGHLGNRYADKSYSVACAQFWVYLFHMPAFIFVSGLFAKRTVNEKRWARFVPYLFLYIGMKMLNFALVSYLKGISSASLDFFHENGIPWFALALFWFHLITILTRKVRPAYVMTVAVLLAAASGYSTGINSFLVMQRTIIFFPFFYAGYLTDPGKLSQKLSSVPAKLVSAALVAGTIAFTFLCFRRITSWRILFRGIAAYEKIKTSLPYAWGWSWRIAGYLISLVLTLAVISLMPSAKSFLSDLGRRTLPVFVFHSAMISLFVNKLPGFKKWLTGSRLGVHCLLFAVIIVLITSLPVFEWPLKKLMNVPERKD